MANTRIVELMAAPTGSRDLSWLRESLQAALELEFSTLPIYLSGMWSIKSQSGEACNLIKSVVLEEMLHLGFACNMLKAIGGTPRFVVPEYPGHLPGGVLPDLEVYLAGLSLKTLDMYMAIEEPENPLAPAETDYPTIGMFYDAIRELFQTLSPPISTDGQLTTTLHVPDPDGSSTTVREPLPVLASLDDVVKAIDTIKDQGEGNATSPDSPEFGGELAHYYRFGEIRYGRKFVQVGGTWCYSGDPVPFPECHPVARVPRGGYPDLPASRNFNTKYSELVAALQNAWSGGGDSALSAAVGLMFTLYPAVTPIITAPLPDGSGNYGPDFIPAAP
ncbi:MAG: ferritin-like protein [Pseudonocardiales bacterium]|nr:ferritin-like protein [Pseudonocardiales bacterium]MBV9032373.1 ferritin-like protein [Pseudonocardiales bacterium]MBW0011374.1 ferritin-like protein [Pseudonocardiales bacterium]